MVGGAIAINSGSAGLKDCRLVRNQAIALANEVYLPERDVTGAPTVHPNTLERLEVLWACSF